MRKTVLQLGIALSFAFAILAYMAFLYFTPTWLLLAVFMVFTVWGLWWFAGLFLAEHRPTNRD